MKHSPVQAIRKSDPPPGEAVNGMRGMNHRHVTIEDPFCASGQEAAQA